MNGFVGQQIRKWRKLQGLSQKELASSLYISHSTISRVEQGLGEATDTLLHTLSTKFKVNIDWLRHCTEPMLLESDNHSLPIFSDKSKYSDIISNSSILGYYDCTISTEPDTCFSSEQAFVIKIISRPIRLAVIGDYVGISKIYDRENLNGHYLCAHKNNLSFVEFPYYNDDLVMYKRES
jgi:transcriptional regulator with XRE-family HTH domain